MTKQMEGDKSKIAKEPAAINRVEKVGEMIIILILLFTHRGSFKDKIFHKH